LVARSGLVGSGLGLGEAFGILRGSGWGGEPASGYVSAAGRGAET
jgi:hypothetical protein